MCIIKVISTSLECIDVKTDFGPNIIETDL